MFRFPLALVVGATLSAAAAHADTIIIQSTPTLELGLPSLGLMPDLSTNILEDPAFHRAADLCDTLELDCDTPRIGLDSGVNPDWTLRHIADAEKRLALLVAERHDQIAAMEDHFEALPLPLPRPNRRPSMLFGWNAPLGVPHIGPRPFDNPSQFGDLAPLLPPMAVPQTLRPRAGAGYTTLPRGSWPHRPDLSGFYHRLNTPAMIPRGMLPGGSFPWRRF